MKSFYTLERIFEVLLGVFIHKNSECGGKTENIIKKLIKFED